jgi:exopolysaccharide biosynthesis protein
MLIKGGQLVYTTPDDGMRARRSVIAFDRSGQVLLIAFPGHDFTLRELADWLVTSDLDIEAAMNLDGGASTGLCVNTAMYRVRLDAFSPLPMVLLVHSR